VSGLLAASSRDNDWAASKELDMDLDMDLYMDLDRFAETSQTICLLNEVASSAMVATDTFDKFLAEFLDKPMLVETPQAIFDEVIVVDDVAGATLFDTMFKLD